jgi:hypothetical protein
MNAEISRIDSALEKSIVSLNDICNNCPDFGKFSACVNCSIEINRNKNLVDATRQLAHIKAKL